MSKVTIAVDGGMDAALLGVSLDWIAAAPSLYTSRDSGEDGALQG